MDTDKENNDCFIYESMKDLNICRSQVFLLTRNLVKKTDSNYLRLIKYASSMINI